MSRAIDSHLHVWSTNEAPFAWKTSPPEPLHSVGTTDALRAQLAPSSPVKHAVIIQPNIHGFDHAYVNKALAEHPNLFRGMCLANPSLGASAAVEEVRRLKLAHGYVGLRLNPSLFEDNNMANATGLALVKAAEELQLVVGVMAFAGLDQQLEPLKRLIAQSPSVDVVIDHCGFFRQPAFGGLVEGKAENREGIFADLLSLSVFPRVHVKMSALFRTSAQPFPHVDLIPRLLELLKAFGKERILWGSDFPFVTIGGHEKTAFAVPYARSAAVFDEWIEWLNKDEGASAEAQVRKKQAEVIREAKEFMLWKNAAKLFHFDQ